LNATDEVRYHPRAPSFGASSQVQGQTSPYTYDTLDMGIGLPSGTATMAAVDYVRILSSFDLSPNPLFDLPGTQAMMLTEVADGWYRGFARTTLPLTADPFGPSAPAMFYNGLLQGSCATGFRREDGLCIVMVLNTNPRDGLQAAKEGRELTFLANEIVTWPSWDLFPEVGIVLP